MLKLLAAMVVSLSTSGATCLFPLLPLLSLIGMPATLEVARSAGGQAAGKIRRKGARDEEDKSDTVRLTLALGHNEKTYALRMALMDETAAANFELKQGKAPASFMERDLQRWLEALR